ncbi:MAG: ubiquinol-cytochrome c reductase iron-sulfur subunit, partial [Rhodospirillaceae bacterium]|nr:ubiquinol-cytochrome c reductase iron-sulfur subunit [Rhodospirillaceae bacterium]
MADSASTDAAGAAGAHEDGAGRRDFLILAGGAFGAFAAGASAWPLLDSLNPAKDTL